MDASTPLGALLPHLSTLARGGGPPRAVYLCCTFPQIALGGRYPLSLPCGARTFLTHGLSALCPRLSVPVAQLLYRPRGGLSNRLHLFCRSGIIFMAAPHDSTSRFGEKFFVKSRFEKCRNTLCISSFSNRRIGGKDPLKRVEHSIRPHDEDRRDDKRQHIGHRHGVQHAVQPEKHRQQQRKAHAEHNLAQH